MSSHLSEKVNFIISIILTKKELLQPIKYICNEGGFSIDDIKPKTEQEFGDEKTPHIIKSLRFKNFETRRIKRVVRVLRGLKDRNLLIYSSTDISNHSLDQSFINDVADQFEQVRTKREKSEHLLKVHENAAINSVLNLRARLRKIKQKEKRHKEALEQLKLKYAEKKYKLSEKDQKRKLNLEKRRLERDLFERNEIKKQLAEMSKSTFEGGGSIKRYKSVEAIKEGEVTGRNKELEQIYSRLEEGYERACRLKINRSYQARRELELNRAKEFIKIKEKKEKKNLVKNISEMMQGMKTHESIREGHLSEARKKISKLNSAKRNKTEETKRIQKIETRKLEAKLLAKDRELAKRLLDKQNQRYLDLCVHNEKKYLRKLNEEENLRKEKFALRKKQEKIIEKLSHESLPAIKGIKSPISIEESITSTKLNANQIIANLRSKVLE